MSGAKLADDNRILRSHQRWITGAALSVMLMLWSAPTARAQTQVPDARGFGGPVTTGGGGRGAARGGARGTGTAAVTTRPFPPIPLGAGPSCSLDATIYDVRIPADQIGRMDLDALNLAAGSPTDFEKALRGLGTIKPLYRISNVVRLASDYVILGGTMPYITGSVNNPAGGVTNTVNFSNAGAQINISGKAAGGDQIDLDMSMQISSLGESQVTIGEAINAPIFRTVTLLQKGIVRADQPCVIVGVAACSRDADGKAVARVARVTLGAPQSAPGRGQ
jgi:hypothetical protein